MSVKLMFMTSTLIILSIVLALLPSAIRGVQPTAEFVLLVVAPVLWNYVSTRITAPFLYVLLNIVLVTLGFSSPTPPTSKDDQPHNSGLSAQIESIETRSDAHIDQNNIIVESKLGDPVEKILSPAASPDQVQKPTAPLIMERRSSSFKDLKATLMPAPALYNKESRLRRSTVNLSNISRESRGSREMIITESCTPTAPKRSVPQLVVFEISSDMGNQAHLNDDITVTKGDEETEISHREEEGKALSADELYVKAESFIRDFYRQLKMQREDSWNRL